MRTSLKRFVLSLSDGIWGIILFQKIRKSVEYFDLFKCINKSMPVDEERGDVVRAGVNNTTGPDDKISDRDNKDYFFKSG